MFLSTDSLVPLTCMLCLISYYNLLDKAIVMIGSTVQRSENLDPVKLSKQTPLYRITGILTVAFKIRVL